MTLGSQDGPNNGEANDTDEIGAVLPNHETSYNTKEATNINKDARYLKFEVTRTKVGSDKWVRFSELEERMFRVKTIRHMKAHVSIHKTENSLICQI